jgi:hypothetical protein
VERCVRDLGARLVFLKRPELENYWTAPDLVHTVLAVLAGRISQKRGEPVEPPRLESVRAELEKHTPDEKGSNILRAVWKLADMEYRKKDAALVAVGRMRELARDDADALMAEIKDAFA